MYILYMWVFHLHHGRDLHITRHVFAHHMHTNLTFFFSPSTCQFLITEPSPHDQSLIQACRDGNVDTVKHLIEEAGADPTAADPSTGITPLMAAAEEGHIPILQYLLQEQGVPWNAQDAEGYTAGEYASGGKHPKAMQFLLDWAVSSELLLSTAFGRTRSDAVKGNNEEKSDSEAYLQQKLECHDSLILDQQRDAVMMSWEAPLMEKHADIIFGRGINGSGSGADSNPGSKDILNVGFGMGIIDEEIQKRHPRTHTIIEAHPDVYARMIELGWDKKPGVEVLFGKWQEVVPTLIIGRGTRFDGIFWDTYAEYYEDQREFHEMLPKLLKPGGIYSFFNGLCPDNFFFHLTAGEIARRELNQLGLRVKYDAIPIDASSKEIWAGVANRYWHLPMYFIPTCELSLASPSAPAVEDA